MKGSTLKGLLAGAVLGAAILFAIQLRRANDARTLDAIFGEHVVDRFYSDAATITGKQALQVAKLRQTEYIERTSDSKAFFVDLPRVVVRAKVPVEYGFFVPMTDGWRFRLENGEVLVGVPELTNGTPAVDVGRLEFDVVKGSLFRNEKAVVENLRSELMGLLTERAIGHRDLARDQARDSIAEFVRGWLARQTGRPVTAPIRVVFPGEPDLSEGKF